MKSFGAELNKMKSYFIKESKILAHNEKEALYSKLLQSAQEQYEKLQSRIANIDELLEEAESCLADLEADSEWEECETDCSDDEMEEEDSESRKLEEELGSLKAQEKELLSFTEWEISEWSERQAVFNFLHDSIELTVVFGTPVGKLQNWQTSVSRIRKVLHDVSLVVSRCRILGEEIQFLERWGGKYNLLKTDIVDTNVKLLFSSSTASAKFELTLSLSSSYPSSSLPFTVEKKIGKIGREEISAVLSEVPAGYHYLRRMVSSIHQSLLQDPR
ncbi:hypothetical protein ASZ78_011715 [Callipepla squamata]|uniref:Knl1 C-terminal RWD domain-containing protein n=1 Tax=Callipepla squamata TaxID=9009 RepID=A0A226MLJ9_CALSU|nr:hypothetical protein ASZ78_011715 [Callipepla squamata]